ncbi:MAG: GNAT family N-acetyltransferase [Candidatus Aenigmarchaeota archaeon]|nr:GNAT family N-acetyltransferase [Candidatus Aenigmarchaeota archaeon]
MLTGKVIEESKIGNYSVKFRYPKFEDLEDILKYINSLVEERVYINMQKKISKKEELEFLTDLLKNVENKEAVSLVAEVNGKVGGLANINKKRNAESHIGNFGISLRKDLRGKGIGKRLTELVIKEAVKNLKIEIVELEVFAENKVALNLYKKSGFKKVGVIKKGLKKDGKYSDHVFMVKYL